MQPGPDPCDPSWYFSHPTEVRLSYARVARVVAEWVQPWCTCARRGCKWRENKIGGNTVVVAVVIAVVPLWRE